MSWALFSSNTTLSQSWNTINNAADGTYSFSVSSTSSSGFKVDDDDNFFNDGTGDTNQVVAPSSTFLTAGAPVGNRFLMEVTPDNGDPAFNLYIVYENSNTELDPTPSGAGLNTYSQILFVTEQQLVPGVNYTITLSENFSGNPTFDSLPGLLVCFNAGTLIETSDGPRPVESLKEGNLVMTRDSGLQPMRLICSAKFDVFALRANPKLRPIKISRGALGNGLPKRDLLVSRQHRIQMTSEIAEQMFSVPNILIAAIKLTELPGVQMVTDSHQTEYFHLMFDKHEVIYAEGAPCESLYTGPEALKAVSPEAREEILTIFPALADHNYKPEPACFIPSNQDQKRFVKEMLSAAKS